MSIVFVSVVLTATTYDLDNAGSEPRRILIHDLCLTLLRNATFLKDRRLKRGSS